MIKKHYDNNVISIDHTQTGFSTAIFKDKLEQYIYSLGLDDLKDVNGERESGILELQP